MQYKTEYSIFNDYEAAREYLRDFLDGSSRLTVDQYSSRNGTDYLVIFENEESSEKPYYLRSKLKAMRRDELIELWRNQCDGYLDSDDIIEAELIDDLMEITRREYFAKHYEQNNWRDIEEYDFCASGYSQGDAIKVCNADDIYFITPDHIRNLFFDVPIAANAELWKREDSDDKWEFVECFNLCHYTDLYNPSYGDVYKGLINEKNPLAHLVAFDMPNNIFENIE